MYSIKRTLNAAGVLALLLAAALPAAAQEQAPALATTNEVQAPLLEPRWLPWLGCWELTADVVDYRMVESTGRRIVCVTPRLDGLGVNLTTQIEGRVIADNTIVADGIERTLPEADCSGRQTASWSADGRRLHSSVRATCAEDTGRSLTGLSMLVEDGSWIELQSVSFDDGEHRELVIRQYKRLGAAETQGLGFATLDPALAARAARARAAAAAPLDVDDVLEAWEIFPVEVVEAAILESNSMFALDGKALVRLADAGVEDRVIDLMVAVSFPEEFVVDNGASYGGGGGGGAMYLGFYGFGGSALAATTRHAGDATTAPFTAPTAPAAAAAGTTRPTTAVGTTRPTTVPAAALAHRSRCRPAAACTAVRWSTTAATRSPRPP